MARSLDRIWVRFGLWIAATVLLTMASLTACVMLFGEWQYQGFYRDLPAPVQNELTTLQDQDLEDGPRAMQIYGQYWKGDLLFGEKWSLLIGLLVCLPIGLAIGFWVSRFVTLPLASMAEAAQRIALGDFTVRAEPGRDKGEMADMVRDFNHMTDSLEELERERKTTAAAVSHELRTPLAVLRARLHAVCDGVIPPSEAEFRTLLHQVEHLGRLVDDLHTLSVADAGRLSLQRSRFRLDLLVGDLLQAYASRFAEQGMHAELRLDATAVLVDADPDRMRQVVSNLIDNVLRHASDGGWLEIGLALEQPALQAPVALLTVSDAGPGLPEDVRKHLFERFLRSDHSRSRATGGSGLGLSIVRVLVERQGGSVSADESPRGGMRFTIRMPIADAPLADEPYARDALADSGA